MDDSVLKCQREKAERIQDHLNTIEPNIIKYTKEEEENNQLVVSYVKKKKIEFNDHYKKTNTNIAIKKRSNHRDSIKRGVIKGAAATWQR